LKDPGVERSRRQRQTLASFDYQWGHMADGEAMLSDEWFTANVDRIIADELLGIDRTWFHGRAALDAGCGGGRWTLGLLRLGCRVLAVDASPHAVQGTLRRMERLAPQAIAEGRLEAAEADLLRPAAPWADRRFDLVFSFGVLHHTGDTRRALRNVAARVAPSGVLFLYLYGRSSAPLAARTLVNSVRMALSPLSFSAKRAVLARLLPRRDPHQAFDLLSPLINETLEDTTVEAWLREEGLVDVARTLPHTDLFVRAARAGSSLPVREAPPPPYWFERYRRRT
jgi:SAM-dependent methyltransferase